MSTQPTESTKRRLYDLLLEDAKDKGYSLRSINWYMRELKLTKRFDVSDALNEMANEKTISRRTHWDGDIRRCRIIPKKKENPYAE